MNFVLEDLEGEQRENSLRNHSEKLAIVFGMMSLSREKTIRIRKKPGFVETLIFLHNS
jgi:hypothetical protein